MCWQIALKIVTIYKNYFLINLMSLFVTSVFANSVGDKNNLLCSCVLKYIETQIISICIDSTLHLFCVNCQFLHILPFCFLYFCFFWYWENFYFPCDTQYCIVYSIFYIMNPILNFLNLFHLIMHRPYFSNNLFMNFKLRFITKLGCVILF